MTCFCGSGCRCLFCFGSRGGGGVRGVTAGLAVNGGCPFFFPFVLFPPLPFVFDCFCFWKSWTQVLYYVFGILN